MGKDVIVACDFPDRGELAAFLDKLEGRRPYLKIGMELFYALGPAVVEELKSRGCRVFLDLKLHDIPNTVKRAMAVLAGQGTDMVNVHAAGTRAMMEAALEGLSLGGGPRPLLLAVTQLTSTDQKAVETELLIPAPMERVVEAYAKNAAAAGLDGVVCSPLEAAGVHAACGAGFLTVTPGIRFPEGETGDQKRVMSPALAKEAGSDYIVVGRPITRASDPAAAYDRCLREFVG